MIKNVGVIGGGQMGSGIAQVMATAGYAVKVYDVSNSALQHSQERIEKSLGKHIKRADMSPAEKQQVLGNISWTTMLSDFSNCDFMVEAAPEDFALKCDLYQKVCAVLPKHALLLTNTSALSITELAANTDRPAQFMGMHFMNPVPVMHLVELIRGLQTSDQTFQTVTDMTQKLGKIQIISRDYPGFIMNRILMPMLNEAMFTVYEGIATPEDIDTGMKLGTKHPMGPLELADFIGLDTCLAIMETLYHGFSDSKYRPCPLLKKHVEAGWLGLKTGRGFYKYDK